LKPKAQPAAASEEKLDLPVNAFSGLSVNPVETASPAAAASKSVPPTAPATATPAPATAKAEEVVDVTKFKLKPKAASAVQTSGSTPA